MTVSLGIPSDAAALDGVRELERKRLRELLRQRMFGQQAAPGAHRTLPDPAQAR
jgi:hypothetical protein